MADQKPDPKAAAVARALKLRADVELKTMQAKRIIAGFDEAQAKAYAEGKTAQDSGSL